MRFSIHKALLFVTLVAVTVTVCTAAPRLSPRLSIVGNVAQSSIISGSASNSAGVVGNIIDNSANNGSISNGGRLGRRLEARISIGGSGNSDNVIGANNGSGNIIDNSGNTGNLTNEGQNNNGGIVVNVGGNAE